MAVALTAPFDARHQAHDSGERQADQATLAHLQVTPSPLNVRAQSARRACDSLVTAVAAYRQIAMVCSGDMKVHIAASEFKPQMGADVAAMHHSGYKNCIVFVAHLRCVHDFTADHNREPAREPNRSGSFPILLGSRLTAGSVAARCGTTPADVIVPVRAIRTSLALCVTPVGLLLEGGGHCSGDHVPVSCATAGCADFAADAAQS